MRLRKAAVGLEGKALQAPEVHIPKIGQENYKDIIPPELTGVVEED